MVELKQLGPKPPTVKAVKYIIGRLSDQGSEGSIAIQKMATKIYYWNDLHTIAADRKEIAVCSLKAFREGYDRWKAQREFQLEQEKKSQAEREARAKSKPISHELLQSFRDEFDRVHAISDAQERGNLFQDLMNKIFEYYCESSKGAFTRTGEQIDGLFYFDKHWYYVEVRWKSEKANAGDVSILRDRAKSAFGGDTKALFISFNGFSEVCLEALRGMRDERVILMDGFDLRCVLDCQIAFDVLLAEKQVCAVRDQRPFIGALEIIRR